MREHHSLCPFAEWPEEDCFQRDAGVSICHVLQQAEKAVIERLEILPHEDWCRTMPECYCLYTQAIAAVKDGDRGSMATSTDKVKGTTDMSQCWAYDKSHRRCVLDGGHSGDHTLVVRWTDEECFDPSTLVPRPPVTSGVSAVDKFLPKEYPNISPKKKPRGPHEW